MKIFRSSTFAILVLISSFMALQAQDIIITGVSTTDVSCGSGSDGTITINISGGIGLYTYLLVRGAVPVESSGPIAAQNFTFTGHDKYTNYIIIVSDEDAGTADGFTFATIDGPNPITITSSIATNITCNGANDGTITVTATGEGGNFIFNLTGPVNQTNETGFFSGLPQGDYTVTVSDKDGCPSTDVTPVLTINNPGPITITTDNITDVACFGDNTGSISITPGGGTPSGIGSGYTYEWTGPGGFTSTTEDITNLESGDYFITVYDGNMCSANDGPINISQPPDITAILDNTTDVTCNGGNDGIAQVTAGGGAGGYTYSWDGQFSGLISTDEDPIILVADTYDLTIFDTNGCSKTFISFATINEPAPFAIAIDGTTDVTCSGGTDGTASITPSGGTSPYTFFWTGAISGYSSTDEDPVNMPADVYSLTITDASGCSQLFSSLLTINEPAPISVVVNGTTEVSCFGGNDGTASITVTGGTPPFNFIWSGDGSGHTSGMEDPNDLVADTYDLTVTDNSGCVEAFNDLVTISEPADLSVTVDNITNVDCNGAATGSIEITPAGGTPIYSFLWSGPNGFSSSSEDISNLEAGNYSLTITDALGCIKDFIDVATVSENTTIDATFLLTDISCNGGSDGAIDATVSGGTPTYVFSWTGPFGFTASTEDITGLMPGLYSLTVTDDLGCIQVMPVQTLTEPSPLSVSATQVDIDCFDAANGSIDLTISGGTVPYTFAWTGPGGYTASTEDIASLEPGAYSVTVTDANLCSSAFTDIATILEPAEIQVSSIKSDISCGGLTDGSIDITVAGGILPYGFDWTGPGGFTSTSEDISGLEAGSYSLTITDGNGCVVSFPDLETIIEPTPIVATYVSQQDVLCNGDASGSIEINVTGGTAPLTFDWTNSLGTTESTDEDPTGLAAETYSLSITDVNGCSVSYPDLVTITEPPAISVSLAKTDIVCYGDGNGSITVTASGGTPPYEYSRLGDLNPAYQPGNSFTGIGPGFYTIWVRDANLCVVTETITIQEPEEIQILGETKSGQNLCYGDSSAQISIDVVTGGVLPYEYSINGGVDFYSTSLFTNLPAGDYQTVVRDASGCTASGNLNVITQPSMLRVDSYLQEDIITCFDALEGRIVIVGTGGNGVITYALNGGVPVVPGDFQNLPGGPYQVTMEDENGCTRDTSVVILTPPEIVVDNVTITDVTGCSGDPTGSLSVTGSGGTGTITYSLNGGSYQAGGTFNGLSAGDHTVTLKDDNDCTRDTLVSISEPASISILTELVTPITCAGAGDGIVEVTVTGGTAPLNFTLNPGAVSNGTGIFSGLMPGTYTVSVDDAEGCGPVDSSPLTITDPPVLLIDSLIDRNISCNGAGDGSISIYVSGGVAPYEYSIDNQGAWTTDSFFTGLIPDTYEVYIRDFNFCLVYGGSFVFIDPPLLSVSVTTTDITTCSGDTTGVIVATGSGGTGNLEYSLDGLIFQSSGTFSNLPADSYTVYVLDEGGCSVTEPVTINEPDPVMATITKTDATFGNLGSITISETTGGTPPYEYTIDGPSGSFSPDTTYDMLEEGTYHVIVRDLNGCTYEEMVDILDVPPLDVIVNVTHVSCFGANDGTIEFVPQDAEGSVEYSIDSGFNFVTGALFENLPGNSTYYLVAKDEIGKVFTDSVTITEPSEISLSRNITAAECNAFSETGAIDITVMGGSGTYNYLWSDGSTEEDRSNIVAGDYILEITDSDNCTRTDMIVVSSVVIVNAYAGTDTTICHGESIQLYGQGGHIPQWSPATFLSDPDIADPIATGVTETTIYVLTITEETSPYGCFNTDSVTVSIFPLTGIYATEDTFIIEGSSIELEATGGPFIAYRWEPSTGLDNNTIPNPMATPLVSTWYHVYGTNENGCEEVDSVFIEVIEDIRAYNVFSPNGDGVNDFFDIENASRFPEMIVEVYSRWGDQLFSTRGYDDGSRWDGTARGKDAPVGTYYFIIIPYSGAKPITGNVTIIR
ncbi:MAG: gliding motility-associated C-terminal domain-containing protein [Bacteroidales bacterium]|nr:gliding motility-associated C-terminal domain-containing protein [Bacteroidales bacterium]